MPGMDGYELAQRLRQQFPPAALTLIAITGFGQGEDMSHTREAGFAHHLLKPVDMATVIKLLEGS
jgi:CheY-like chemotaxis protein